MIRARATQGRNPEAAWDALGEQERDPPGGRQFTTALWVLGK
jgi:hypothetical protein